jgi:hypothetical protein
MEIPLNWVEVQFLEYLQGGPLPADREHWIALKASIELATIQAFEQAERHLCGYYGNNELAVIATF